MDSFKVLDPSLAWMEIDQGYGLTLISDQQKTRGKPSIDILEDIRRMLMARMQDKRELILKSNDTICPNIRKKLKENNKKIRYFHVTLAGNMKFEVQELDKTNVVNLMGRTCSCQHWDLFGIPCKHVISCISWLKEEPNQYIDNYSKRDAYLKTYELLLQPLTVKDTWPEVKGPHVLPPPVRRCSVGQRKKEEETCMKMIVERDYLEET
ncbi:hypothetical protein Cni_G19893 [Canna indica]|uniref:SWIM-type domain-containing protein n=1 Tax=Canna indica TaxID=4628 RepID=A0AAQ3KSH5_9LILI|nr:hypothetical protein Cni_G19893 [Canna indica]